MKGTTTKTCRPGPLLLAGLLMTAMSGATGTAVSQTCLKNGNCEDARRTDVLRAWDDKQCTDPAILEGIVDDAMTRSPFNEAQGTGRGSSAVGYSVAIHSPECGTFTYAIGVRNLETQAPLTPWNRMDAGSLTKPMFTAVTLALAERGAFGPMGIDTPVEAFLTPEEVQLLTVGSDPANPRCPALIFDAGIFEPVQTICPNLSAITIRQLMDGTSGLVDAYSQQDRDFNGIGDLVHNAFATFNDLVGISYVKLPPDIAHTFDGLTAIGILGYDFAEPGGQVINGSANTGYILLAEILRRVSGSPLQNLLDERVNSQVAGVPAVVLDGGPPDDELTVHSYFLTTGFNLALGLPPDLLGVYPVNDSNGHPAIALRELDNFVPSVAGELAGGTAISTPSYVLFFHRLATGDFLSETGNAQLEASFKLMPWGTEIGFGLMSRLVRPDFPELGQVISKSGSSLGSRCRAENASAPNATAVVCRNSTDPILPRYASTGYDPDLMVLDLLSAVANN